MHAFATNLRVVDSIYLLAPFEFPKLSMVVLTANTHTLRSGEHTRPRYSEDR